MFLVRPDGLRLMRIGLSVWSHMVGVLDWMFGVLVWLLFRLLVIGYWLLIEVLMPMFGRRRLLRRLSLFKFIGCGYKLEPLVIAAGSVIGYKSEVFGQVIIGCLEGVFGYRRWLCYWFKPRFDIWSSEGIHLLLSAPLEAILRPG